MDHLNLTFDFDFKKFNFSISDLLGDKNEDQMSTQEKAIKIFVYVIAILISFVGNLILIIVILATKSLRTKFNFYILNLAVADILVPATCMWLHLITDFYPSKWTLGVFFCRINTFSQVLVVSAGIFTLLATILDRFLAAEHPSYLWITQGHQVFVIVLIWIFAAVLALPWLLYTHLVEFDWFTGHEVLCQAKFPSRESRKIYTTIFAIIGYAIPIWIMCVCVVLSMGKPKKTNIPLTVMNHSSIEMKRRAVNMLMSLLIVFFVCWTPQQSLRLWDVYRSRGPHTKLPAGIEEYTFVVFYMAYFSTCCHPIIYIYFNKCFRHAAVAVIKCKINKFSPTTVHPEIASEVPLHNFESEFEDQHDSNPSTNREQQEQDENQQAHHSTDHRYSFSDIQLYSCYQDQEQAQTSL